MFQALCTPRRDIQDSAFRCVYGSGKPYEGYQAAVYVPRC